MMNFIYMVLPSFVTFSSALSFRPCPLLGPAFPPFSLNANDDTVANALQNLTETFDNMIATNTGSHGDVSPNTTFSIALFSTDRGTAEDEAFFWQYHHTSPALNQSLIGSRTASKDSIYRIGGLTEAFTVWSLLLTGDGDQILDDPITKYLPELVNGTADQYHIRHVTWDEITVGQLASHMSGVARDYCSKDVTLETGPGITPSQDIHKPCCGNGPKCGSDEFLQYLANQAPVAPPGVTPSYSNMAFQLLGYIVARRAGQPFGEVLQRDIFDVLGLTETSIFAPVNSSAGIIPTSKEASGWLAHHGGDEASTSIFSTVKDLSIAGQAILNSTLLDRSTTNRWFKPVSHTSNPANSIGLPWVIYSGGSYPNTSMVDVYTILSNEGYKEGLYSSYLGLVPDFGVGFAILSADTETPADLNAHADVIGDVILGALMTTATKQAGENFGGAYKTASSSTNLNSSITVEYDDLPGLYIEEFINNGTDFRETLAEVLGIETPADLSIRLYPTQLEEEEQGSGAGSRQAFRAVFQDKTELADNGTPTCVSWLNIDKYRYGGRALDEFIFSQDQSGRAASVEIPALRVALRRG
ncbi:beta-lactamase/transpeptidase-like protein [Aspergillus pseudoustus]|uniref:Beta-lactamase/transpeptidase-like protein n=1 Tax=Aspergillus pseudoustus TaxID=1810923 RepID=A0ABR4J9E1_9EURO